ncbi:TetR family transcriptional regulator (plasmid) [Agrobacterium sp. MA01]|uniref:TetR/AcrR family transcriptional regulator n=1 Tax=Agrobacterium sp. MA01 TaxID=2664893 RepID=UPI00129B5680|nr:TetR/AcrR family transcriptional regulator [Agrobacterium sp. MA01]QGG93278.1 TetR family transcriptional regulator [Agrobacterium sp. MA01]
MTSAKRRPRLTPDEARNAILDATLQLYLDKGYLGTSTDEIASLSGVSKQTIYRHFNDKDDLIRAAMQRLIAAAEDQGADSFERLAESDNLADDLEVFAKQHLIDIIQPEIMRMRRLIIAEVDRFPDVARAWYEAAPKRAHHKLAETFKRLEERGLLLVEDPLLAAEQFNWLILSIPMNRAMFDSDSVFDTSRHQEYAEAAVRVFLAAYSIDRTTRDGLCRSTHSSDG